MASIKNKQEKRKQDDLRRLMKERREKAKHQDAKIDSPFAKYNSLGQLSCSICNVIIKGNNLWGPHIAGRIHKEHLSKQKKSNTNPISNNVTVLGVKRNLEQVETTKKLKSEFKKPLVPPQSVNETSALAGYSSSDDSSADSDSESNTVSSQNAGSNSLPSDFFDNQTSGSINSVSSSSNVEAAKEGDTMVATNNVETLPEGFFDDPVLDAKARNIEYKDPVEEEWERFQKTIAEETNVSKTIIEGDLEESTLERDIDQIDEQIHQWERVKNLQCMADDVKLKAPKKEGDNDEFDSTDDELQEDDLLDWRSKGVKKL